MWMMIIISDKPPITIHNHECHLSKQWTKKNYFTTNVNRIYVEINSKMIRTHSLDEENINTKCRKTVETPKLMKKYEDKNVLSTEVLININDQLEISEFRRYFFKDFYPI